MATADMSYMEFDHIMWSVAEIDENRIFGGSMAESFECAVRLAWSILVAGQTDPKVLFDEL